ncbi:MAG: nuclear transport factor 2 family protein [Burkholderiales bacterium]|nr:nuclear transport factor 2 family protein [Phycisphaerae bacterium]
MLSANKQIVQKFMDGFNKSDHAQILSCLTDDIEWIIPGAFHHRGKEAFDKEIENEAFVGRPIVAVDRMIEENDIVVAEGSVRCQRRASGWMNGVFCDVFVMRDGLIKKLTSYLAEIKE